jgi:hypothetical protein
MGGLAGAQPVLLFFLVKDPVDLLRLLTGPEEYTEGLEGMGGETIRVGGACSTAPTSIDILQPPSTKL